jgi:hypothetical protein
VLRVQPLHAAEVDPRGGGSRIVLPRLLRLTLREEQRHAPARNEVDFLRCAGGGKEVHDGCGGVLLEGESAKGVVCAVHGGGGAEAVEGVGGEVAAVPACLLGERVRAWAGKGRDAPVAPEPACACE